MVTTYKMLLTNISLSGKIKHNKGVLYIMSFLPKDGWFFTGIDGDSTQFFIDSNTIVENPDEIKVTIISVPDDQGNVFSDFQKILKDEKKDFTVLRYIEQSWGLNLSQGKYAEYGLNFKSEDGGTIYSTGFSAESISGKFFKDEKIAEKIVLRVSHELDKRKDQKKNDKDYSKRETAVLVPHDNSTQEPVTKPQMPNFGSPNAKWWGESSEKKEFPKPYGWLNQKNTLLVFDNHLALVRGAEDRSKVANLMGSGAFALVGGLFASARSIKDKISNKSENYDSIRTRNLFNAGEFIWCNKMDAEIWEIQEKRFLGMKTLSYTALYGPFISLAGTLLYLFPLYDTQESIITDPIKNICCKIITKAKGLTRDEALIAYKDLFKNTNQT
jgi:hypothetical protein